MQTRERAEPAKRTTLRVPYRPDVPRVRLMAIMDDAVRHLTNVLGDGAEAALGTPRIHYAMGHPIRKDVVRAHWGAD